MTKIKNKNDILKHEINIPSELDKLAQLTPSSLSDTCNCEKSTLENLKKRARTKFITDKLTNKLHKLNSPLKKSYINTYYCSKAIKQENNKLTTTYCNNRWCLTCNRIRTAKLINKYMSSIDALVDKQFVTLTIKNVSEENLQDAIKLMIRNFQLINKRMLKAKIKITGIRKLECTYNPVSNSYHPHFHLIVESKEVAEEIKRQWLECYPDTLEKLQDIRKANKDSVYELFKYFTKLTTKDSMYVYNLDVMFIAMKGLRVFQAMRIKQHNEDVEEIQSEIYEELEKREQMWEYVGHDWYSVETGEALTGYEPSDDDINLVNNIKFRASTKDKEQYTKWLKERNKKNYIRGKK